MWWWKMQVHGSWIVALISSCFVMGVAAVLVVRIAWGVGVAALAVLAILLVWFRVRWGLPLIGACAVLIGLGYGSAHAGSRDAYLALIGQTVTLAGVLKEDYSTSSSGSVSLQLGSVTMNRKGYPGVVLVTTRSPPAVQRGDIVFVEGTVKAGFGSFPVSLSNARVVLVRPPPVADTGRQVRDWFAAQVRKIIPEPQASLGVGFLTGQKSALPEEVSQALKTVGLTHIVVASGYNLTILVRLARRMFKNISKYLTAVFSVGMVVCFIAVTGLSPSMTRAGLVSGIAILSWYYGRRSHPLVLLPLVAALTVAFQPSFVWGDLGWQLSFAAFAGVMIVAPLVHRYFFGTKEPGFVRQIVGETIAAHMVTVPIIALSFGTLSNIAIVANVLIVPFVPLAMLLTFVAGLWAIAGIGAVWLVALPAQWLLGYMIAAAQYMSEFSWAQSEVLLPSWAWLLYGILLAGTCWWMWRASRYDFRSGDVL